MHVLVVAISFMARYAPLLITLSFERTLLFEDDIQEGLSLSAAKTPSRRESVVARMVPRVDARR